MPEESGASIDAKEKPAHGALSARQPAILRRAIEGKANKEIAQEIALSPASVKLYIVALMARSGARNRVALAASSSLLMSA